MVSSTASAAAQETGLPPKVVPWSPGPSSRPASPKPMQAPIGSPPPRPLARVMTSGRDALALVGEPAPGAADAGLHLVERRAARPARSQIAPGRREVARPAPGRRRPRPGSGSRKTAARCRRRPRAARRRRRRARRSPAAAAARRARAWPACRSAPARPGAAVEAALGRDDARCGRAGARRASLNAASLASAPELAEEHPAVARRAARAAARPGAPPARSRRGSTCARGWRPARSPPRRPRGGRGRAR